MLEIASDVVDGVVKLASVLEGIIEIASDVVDGVVKLTSVLEGVIEIASDVVDGVVKLASVLEGVIEIAGMIECVLDSVLEDVLDSVTKGVLDNARKGVLRGVLYIAIEDVLDSVIYGVLDNVEDMLSVIEGALYNAIEGVLSVIEGVFEISDCAVDVMRSVRSKIFDVEEGALEGVAISDDICEREGSVSNLLAVVMLILTYRGDDISFPIRFIKSLPPGTQSDLLA